jgi:hypothetical protein
VSGQNNYTTDAAKEQRYLPCPQCNLRLVYREVETGICNLCNQPLPIQTLCAGGDPPNVERQPSLDAPAVAAAPVESTPARQKVPNSENTNAEFVFAIEMAPRSPDQGGNIVVSVLAGSPEEACRIAEQQHPNHRPVLYNRAKRLGSGGRILAGVLGVLFTGFGVWVLYVCIRDWTGNGLGLGLFSFFAGLMALIQGAFGGLDPDIEVKQ